MFCIFSYVFPQLSSNLWCIATKNKATIEKQDKKAEIGLSEAGKGLNAYALECKEKELQLLGLCKIKRAFILDAGCGPGTFGIVLAQNGNTIVGIDLSSKVVRVAKERADKERVIFWPIVADLEKLPFNSNAFDLCFCGNVLHHFPDMELVIGELTRALKPRGIFACVENNGSNPLVKLSRTIANGVMGRWQPVKTRNTPNVRGHAHNDYVTLLRNYGITNIRGSSCYHSFPPQETQPKHSRAVEWLAYVFLNRAYDLGIYVLAKILPNPLKGNILLIKGIKG